ncbi:type I-B CRISPR-associated protein Cas7/Cst2/DevR [Aneurinibacillus aneurinilyticus]|uniref:CRISPR-associated regulatory protein, DevR family n=1 Tax=Aneurinibacillus aneurinilyticus ATCC 12856 TaxID=649747 RepID=U1WH23_ANEAE|nr:type I-B CRISPR-associated protein Cas7/Cst2/DevR [Aneurinibacillus aneurinilyticus]ERI07859.1 CRISPR-associated regulatory protein, DevR family [Aneurinibacillus aneurinilyticus ATCC 12856]MED0706324.1 type I-B CRISPR-associated protein Cas7/Cst2/DevR [Aneurinibacillus aneurinilyticus]MED0725264.1 type I-B CRISPR-associated protein Cas7/Cst2/DevR [Aneurinibacillus aneurinilyticus]MED0732322.1 type I-B CRISPR-associated protein Cas7/Cst2/DevR [Aneurinibacillus aneurinilyticus]MED0741494.1 t
MKNKALTLTFIFKASSLNYGEGTANISELKKFHRGDGEVYSFASRQSIRYDMVRLGNEFFNWNLNVVDKSKGVVQFKEDCTIEDSVEMDLFGYMKTKAKAGADKRSAVARLSHAVSLEPYRSDLEFLNNMGLATRINENSNLATLEQHESLYTYTLTIDLSHVGVDGAIELSELEKANRVKQLVEITKYLNREIRGRQENLAPLFVIGGLYPIANPFFLGRVALQDFNARLLNVKQIESVLKQTALGHDVRVCTKIGLVDGTFANENEITELADTVSIEEFYQYILQEIDAYYKVLV